MKVSSTDNSHLELFKSHKEHFSRTLKKEEEEEK